MLDRGQRGGLDAARADPADLLGADEATRLQDLQVLDDAGEGHVERSGELADRRRASAEPFDHVAAAGVGQGLEHPIERGALVKHVLEYRPACPDSQVDT